MGDRSPKSEYDGDDFAAFSEDDLAQIDSIASIYFDTPLSKGGPQVRVELEPDDQDSHEITHPSALPKTPPIETYRRNHILSVTDLVSPVWCEVQFDYGLRQKRYRPLALRPDSFVSASGKEISVEKKVAVVNEVVKEQGKAVHKVLEDELGLKEIKVTIASGEERWAVRMLSLITGAQTILVQGYTRELPVFGILQDNVVVGVIDEVTRCVHPKNKRSNHDAKQESAQSHIDDFFPIQRSPRNTAEKHTHTLMITDTKTRRTDSLPSTDDTLASRLQLMLYHRLLSGLLSEYPPFDFSSLWDRLGLDSSAIFSTQFLLEAGLVTDDRQERMACLDDLVNCWHRTAQHLDVVGVDSELHLVYRLQPKFQGSSTRRRRKSTSQEDRDLALAIEASLRDLDVKHDVDVAEPSPNSASNVPVEQGDSSTEPLKIIGTKQFLYDEVLLENHLTDVLEWWYGKRKPRGVPVHLSRRCFSCEYCTDCEWREEKALEFSREVRKGARM
ncbi:hypothetical protein M378DRAFT_65079 [Amanita muscaria Koide BX008]|uniref:Defects in morphology protein 1 n=1 Tax=Amanita muscaria (strain Koide BX008) TaxID=946122 RepID=A0A0C2XQU5_AMAMK|nr:hypothetical protein M378DRAFT_65079 [Amanita muscaria Koide BX008]